ncbi:MAG: class I SAM-dependent methyltransferase [Gammaproteobacteria bacterium]|nr:class I SAM-dependent methyltransferase [Gammaproteobacteria bacterium]
MSIFFHKIMWSMRRILVGKMISSSALVLEVGSGGNPYPRSNVLLDAYKETRERHWEPLVSDRPTVLSFGENLPFKDKVFDYVIAAHVLEHSPHPEKFLSELQRVAKAGYIETPDAFMERINPYKDHRLEVTVRDDQLIIQKKSNWINDNDLVDLYEKRVKKIITTETIPQHAEEFHMRYFWHDEIKFTVINPDVDATWEPLISNVKSAPVHKLSIKGKIRKTWLAMIQSIFSQKSRNLKIDIIPLLRCPSCFHEEMMEISGDEIKCHGCNKIFDFKNSLYSIH